MANFNVTNVQPIGRGAPYRGKLVAMPTTNDVLLQDWSKDPGRYSAINRGLTIEFPAQPKTIELARSAEYMVVSNPLLPDGYHQYLSTKPLEIPVSFELHAFDRTYCTQGALTILQIASRLHSFVMPITTERVLAQASMRNTSQADSRLGQRDEGTLNQGSQTQDVQWDAIGLGKNKNSNIYPPVTCWLHLIWTESDLPGISCIGYLRDVKVVLQGPFLKGPSGSFNLPTAAEFSFTFIHRPGHNNAFGTSSSSTQPKVSAQQNAYAHDIRDKFYNTRDLVYLANYQGLEDNAADTATPNATTAPTQAPPNPNPPNLTPTPPAQTQNQPAPQPPVNPILFQPIT